MSKKRVFALCALATVLTVAGLAFAALKPAALPGAGEASVAAGFAAPLPEPVAMALLGAGLLGAAAVGRSRLRS